MTTLLAKVAAPALDESALAPFIALSIGMVVALLAGLLKGTTGRVLSVWSGVASVATAATFAAGLWDERPTASAIAGSLVIDRAALVGIFIACCAAGAGILIASRDRGTEDAGYGETTGLIVASTLGMAILASANDLVTVFLGLELLSVPLYVLCASHVDRTTSLESGLKYLILGSVGSATALMGIALIYGATGEMQLDKIAVAAPQSGIQDLMYPGVALLVAGFGFKLSLAPLHQWTPDVYDGAPTAITAFMSVATKAAALIVIARLLVTSFVAQYDHLWHPLLMVLAAASIVVGNVGALGQPSMKRLMGYSSIAQAGYLVAALSVGAIGAMLAYLAAYAVSTLAVFAVVAAREIERPELGDDVAALDGIGRDRPLLAWLGTIGMFGLAGLPLTAGFFGKVFVAGELIAAKDTWLAVLLIIGSIISLAYYVPPVLRMWRPRPVGERAEVDAAVASAIAQGKTPPGGPHPAVVRAPWELGAVSLVTAALVVAGGVYPQPLLELAHDAASILLGVG